MTAEAPADFEMDFSAVKGVEISTNLKLVTEGFGGTIERSLFYDGLLAYGPIRNLHSQYFTDFFRGSGSIIFTLNDTGDAITSLLVSHNDGGGDGVPGSPGSIQLDYVGTGAIPFIRENSSGLTYKLYGTAVCDFLKTASKQRSGDNGYRSTAMKCDDNTGFSIILRTNL